MKWILSRIIPLCLIPFVISSCVTWLSHPRYSDKDSNQVGSSPHKGTQSSISLSVEKRHYFSLSTLYRIPRLLSAEDERRGKDDYTISGILRDSGIPIVDPTNADTKLTIYPFEIKDFSEREDQGGGSVYTLNLIPIRVYQYQGAVIEAKDKKGNLQSVHLTFNRHNTLLWLPAYPLAILKALLEMPFAMFDRDYETINKSVFHEIPVELAKTGSLAGVGTDANPDGGIPFGKVMILNERWTILPILGNYLPERGKQIRITNTDGKTVAKGRVMANQNNFTIFELEEKHSAKPGDRIYLLGGQL